MMSSRISPGYCTGHVDARLAGSCSLGVEATTSPSPAQSEAGPRLGTAPIRFIARGIAMLGEPTHRAPTELHVALLACQHTRRAAQNQPQAASNPHQELRRWLESDANAHSLTQGAIDRIASVANWKKRAGASSR